MMQRLATFPVAGLVPVDIEEANALIVAWGHDLGPCERPFGAQGWVFEVGGLAISAAVSASTVSATCAGYARNEVVELARLCTLPTERWATRVMLRLWREVAAPMWPYWPVRAAVSYSQNDRHEGRIYRFDGWEKVREDCGSNGGGTWSTARVGEHVARGPKTLWRHNYEAAA